MLRAVAKQAAAGVQGSPALLLHARGFLAPASVEFTEEVASASKAPKGGASALAQWGETRAATEQTMALLAGYKAAGDAAEEPYLHYHNPRVFEDLDKPIPNFRKFDLKAGQVPKFFDVVLQKRASEAVEVMHTWWDQRKASVEEGLAAGEKPAFPKLPVPQWQSGGGVSLDALKSVTDAHLAALVPARKLSLPELPAAVKDLPALKSLQGALTAALASNATVTDAAGKPLPGFTFVPAAKLEAKLAERKAAVHARWLRSWAKRILAQPEQALLPLRERDSLLASQFEDTDQKYTALVNLAVKGSVPFGERLAASAAMDGFFLKRSRKEVADAFPVTEAEAEATALAAKLEDSSEALEMLVGPLLQPEGATGQLLSVETRARTEFLYTPDRYLYKQGMELAATYEAEEAAIRAQLKELNGAEPTDAQVAAAQRAKAPAEALAEAKATGAQRAAALEAEAASTWADHAYMSYALKARAALARDAANAAFEEVLYPEVVAERFAIEMAELDAAEAALDEAEEEELWLLTLAQQSRHIAAHIELDLPQAALAHMDPLLYKKLDWETTHGLELLHHEMAGNADCEQGEYLKEQQGLENLAHHFLPLLRYRRAKARAAGKPFAPERSVLPLKSTPAP